ncbi:DUF3300 domain-containing protein [Rhodanobacter sp. DHG33]|uniref:DUF3300 domain-containing protein n=1 Tax=Rhodanobacter sp. DHG33 TaxID=2775921 RepID=UPI00177A7DDA|nr:DUF3300 domain-containing protein [Rhodanobacter sp. DHG33]MBD8899771.1 DUF3300 domain-containing protein [Rhodanobacter sp. DHG33]
MTDRTLTRNTACALLCAGVVMLAGCNKAADTPAANPAASGTAPAPAGTSASAQQAPPYTPPTADQLYQLVAPIALFPDKLVAQVLAGSTYPDQITAADNMLQQNPHVTGTPLANMVNPQPWDPSVKGLTQFPSVLDQMAQNIQWTTSLGEAYVNDPTDVMNAIQVMRQRAQSNGSLRSSSQMQVVSQPAGSTVSDQVVQGGDDAEPVYSGPSVVPAPQQTILLQPAQPDTVYVPQYDPETVYGQPVATYPGYTYVQPSGYSTGQMVAAGAIGFGVGVVVAALLDHHHDGGGPGPNPGWGWNSWGMNWGRHGGEGGYAGGGGWQRPAVVHNNSVYVSRSTTVVNRYVTNNINNSRTVNYVNSNNRTVNNTTNNNQVNNNNRYTNNTTNNRTVNNNVVNERAAAAGQRPATQAMTTPHFGTPVRGAEPARFEQARTAAQPAARPAANEAPRGIARPAQQPRPEAAAAREMPRTEPAHAAAPRPMERPAQPTPERPVQRPAQERPVQRPMQPAQERPAQPAQQRPAERPAPQPMERAPERPAPQPQARPEPQRPAARPAPTHHEAPKPAPKKHDDNQH